MAATKTSNTDDEEQQELLPRSNGARGTGAHALSVATPAPGGFRLPVVSAGALRVAAAACVALSWMLVSNSLILLNKHILKDLSFGCVGGKQGMHPHMESVAYRAAAPPPMMQHHPTAPCGIASSSLPCLISFSHPYPTTPRMQLSYDRRWHGHGHKLSAQLRVG
jgi:hypothetical protein